MESEVNRLPASALTVEELVTQLVTRDDFRGIVVFDPTHESGQEHNSGPDNFQWRSRNCDPVRLVRGVMEDFSRIPSGPTPEPPSNGQPRD